jgi:aspartokinase/homoserine dehydrogenase 1
MAKTGWQVHKFGGSSLADPQCFRRVADILLQDQASDRAKGRAVVVSAIGGMTDALLHLVNDAERSANNIDTGLAAIADRYQAVVRELLGSPEKVDGLLALFDSDLRDVKDVLNAISLVRSAADRSRDLVAGFGELWSARLLCSYLEQRSGGDKECPVKWVDARELLVIEHGEMGPAVLWARSQENADKHFDETVTGIVVVTGFIASDAHGLQTTLGRNGSDFSASILASLLNADLVTIWTDVDGVMSADPNRVPDAQVISGLTYNEAMELAYFGAKVLHPQTMSPAVESDIPIMIRNTFNPDAPGSRIASHNGSSRGVKGVTSIDDVALVNLEGAGMIGVPGTADRLFGALRSAEISVILISQASSEHSICFAVRSHDAEQVERIVRQAFRTELEQKLIQSVEVREQCSIIAIVGDAMAGLPGIAAKFFATFGAAGISVKAIAQGSSERNISAVIAREDATRALRAAHSGFYLSANTISVGLVGPGHVGSMLLDQMATQATRLRDEFSLDFRVRGLVTSSRMLLAERSVDLSSWREALKRDGQPLDWDVFTAHVDADHLPHAAMVDCSASEDVSRRYLGWFSQGIHVVTPNKKAQSGPLDYYNDLHAVRRDHGAHFLYETSVGAALPIIETLRDLRQTGDEIKSIEGIFSGTLAYLFNVFEAGKSFSTIVREARDNGYTEPDPRDDLSGMDVARKLIILAREMGMPLELEDIEVESLVPEGLGEGSIDQFLDALPAYDDAMAKRWRQGRDEGKILRYVGRLTDGEGASVRLEALPSNHPFGNMNLTDNVVRYVSRRYSDNPLVVQGPGAGPEVTAAGVFADLLRLAAYLGAVR